MFSKGSGKTPDLPVAPPADSLSSSGSNSNPIPKAVAVPSIISADLKITGNLTSSGDIQVDGAVEGDISSRTLTVGEDAHIDGSIVAESVRVCGQVSGEVRATSVTLAKTARVRGDIAHQSLSIEAGAYIEGNIRRLEPEAPAADSNLSVSKSMQQSAPPPPPEMAGMGGGKPFGG